MDYTKIDGLITSSENRRLYELQCEIINSHVFSDEDKLIRLAMAQTLSPIGDWESAAELLHDHITVLYGDNLLIAVYIAVTAFEMVRYKNVWSFINHMLDRFGVEDDCFRSISEYLRAKYLKESGADVETVTDILERSINLCPDYAMHYIMLAEYKSFDEKYDLLDTAIANIKKVITAEELWCLPESYFVEPHTVMTTITSTEVTESLYNQLKKRKLEINSEERYGLFKAALSHCGTFLRYLSEDEIYYHIFEEFDGDCISFLNENFLNHIRQTGRLNDYIVEMALELSRKFRALENTGLWNVRAVKESDKWLEILELSDSIKESLMGWIDRTKWYDWFNRRVYSVFSSDEKRMTGFVTEYVNHPTVLKSLAIGAKDNYAVYSITPGSLTVFYQNGEQYSFECYTDTVFSGQYGITVSDDGERIYVISDIKGLWCYSKYGKVLWKTRYTSAGQVYPHSDGTVTCVTRGQIILLDINGKLLKKRTLFDGVRFEMSEKTIAVLISENTSAVLDVKTLEPIVKISLSKLNIYRLDAIWEADEFYVLQGTEFVGKVMLPNGKFDVGEKEVIYLLDGRGGVIRKVNDANWNLPSRAYVDRQTNEVVLYAEYQHHINRVLRIPIEIMLHRENDTYENRQNPSGPPKTVLRGK